VLAEAAEAAKAAEPPDDPEDSEADRQGGCLGWKSPHLPRARACEPHTASCTVTHQP
jgi:hypothetical protein